MKTWLRRILNLLLYLNLCLMLGSGLLLEYRLVSGREGGHGWSALGLTRHDWGELHFWLGVAFCVLIVAHLVLAWRWLKTVAAHKRRWPIIGGLAAGLALVAAFLFLPVEKPRMARDHEDASNSCEVPGQDGQLKGQGGGKGWRGGREE